MCKLDVIQYGEAIENYHYQVYVIQQHKDKNTKKSLNFAKEQCFSPKKQNVQ